MRSELLPVFCMTAGAFVGAVVGARCWTRDGCCSVADNNTRLAGPIQACVGAFVGGTMGACLGAVFPFVAPPAAIGYVWSKLADRGRRCRQQPPPPPPSTETHIRVLLARVG